MARLFVAVRPPPGAVAGVVEPHVTLCFLGEVDGSRLPEVAGALRSGLEGVAPCEAAIAPGPARRLGASALVRRVDGLESLAARVTAAVGRYRSRPDGRPFRGHLTVARRRRGVPAPSGAAAATGVGSEIRWLVTEVILVRSELGRGPGGTARHVDVAVVALGSGSAG